MDDLDCPRYALMNELFVVDTHDILTAVSMVHKCESSCGFVSKSFSRNVERENISTSRLEFIHDYSNVQYCLNIFCLCA